MDGKATSAYLGVRGLAGTSGAAGGQASLKVYQLIEWIGARVRR